MTDHYTKEIALRDFSLRILIDLHQPLRIRPDGDDQASRARELLHERRRYRPRRRADVNRVVRALLSIPYSQPPIRYPDEVVMIIMVIIIFCSCSRKDGETHRVARRL